MSVCWVLETNSRQLRRYEATMLDTTHQSILIEHDISDEQFCFFADNCEAATLPA